MSIKKISKDEILNALGIIPFGVSKIRQLNSRLINIVFFDGHSANFSLSNPVILF
jgi:prepilin-type processing-associated H-X9-DG protein